MKHNTNKWRLTSVACISTLSLALGATWWYHGYTVSKQEKLILEQAEDYQQQLKSLDINISYLKEKLKDTNEELVDANKELEKFTNPIDYSAAAPLYDIPLSKELQRYTYETCVNYDCEGWYEYILAIMWQESNYTPDLISSTDDYGIMQINKVNHQYLKEALGIVDFLEPKNNINAGVYIFSRLLKQHGNGITNTHHALMAYNMGNAGASKLWKIGIHTSFYSESVAEKAKLILADNYS